MSLERPRLCIRITAAPDAATTSARAGSYLRALTSFTRLAPRSSAARATSALYVSIDIGMVTRPASRSSTGSMRRRSSSADTSAAPGRVDSPPTSIRSAPASCIASAASTARAGSRKWPPSAKESGVTFRTPMRSVLSPRSSTRPPGSGIEKRGRRGRTNRLAGSRRSVRSIGSAGQSAGRVSHDLADLLDRAWTR